MAELCRLRTEAATGKSLLKLQVGDEIRLTEADFVRLSKAFLAEMEKKYS